MKGSGKLSLSFQESLKQQMNKSTTSATYQITSTEESIMPMSYSEELAVQSENEVWTRSERYVWYDEFDDTNISIVDDQKNIKLDESQVNLSQEELSQYIPFEMSRRYDNFDIAVNARLQFHYVNAEGGEDYVNAVNVQYTTDRLRFALLVPYGMTYVSGLVQFEIIATGTNSRGENYKWISRAADANVIKSLSGNGIIDPTTSDWYTQFIRDMDAKIAVAQSAVLEAQDAAKTAQAAVSQVEDASSKIQGIVDDAKGELQQTVDEQVTTALSAYYTSEEVDNLLKNVDLTDVYDRIDNIDGLANFDASYDSETRILTFYNGETVIKTVTINSNPTVEWVSAYDTKIDTKISEAVTPVQTELDTYKTTVNDDLQSIHSAIDDLPQTLETDYYNKETTDSRFATKIELGSTNTNVSALTSSVEANRDNVSSLSAKVSELDEIVSGIDTSPSLTYDVAYNDEETGENVFRLYEVQNEGDAENEIKTIKKQFVIQGGGGGGTTGSVLKIEYITKSPLTVTVNDAAVIRFNFSGTDSSGDAVTEGTATWRIGNRIIATSTVISGENSFDATDYISLGTQKIVLSITDDAGSVVTKTWTVQKIDVRLESTFNDTLTYPIGTVSFDYTPYGAISKEIHFILDNTELPSVTTTSSGIPMAYTLPSQSHGSHLLDAYITAELNGSAIESNHITKDIIWYDSSSNIPVISCVQQNITVKQYDTTNIIFSVYDPKTETPQVILSVDGEIVSTLTLTSNTHTWQYKSTDVGEHILTITCGDTVKTLHVTVEKLDIDISPVTAGLAFDFNPIGRSNNDADRLWSDGDVSMAVSDNFDWINGGYQIDDNGDQYFCVKAGTTAVIDYKLFADDAKRNGKEFKLVFKTTNVRKADATFLSCVDGTTSRIGIQMNVHEAYIHASAGSLYLPYSEEDIIEFEFNINKNTDSIPMVMGYEDGVATRPMIYSDSHDFTQVNPQFIIIGSNDCDVLIYRLKVYSTSLTDTGILSNFIADARSADEMIDRYNRNQIYDENNLLTPESLANACPQLKIIKLECPHFTNDKKDFVKNTNIECIHVGGDPVLDNWTAKNAYHSGQGTTSNEYGASGRNIDILMCFDGEYKNSKITYDPDYKTILTLGDGTVYDDGTGKVTLTRTSIPNNYFNIKVNIASSENANNSLFQKRYNDYLPYKSVAQQNDSRVKNSMEFVNCVLFVKESDPDLSSHREFQDNNWHFYAIGNIGDSKKSDKTRVNDPNDPKEFVVEIMDNTLPNSTFSGAQEALDALDADQFDEDGTYGFRYEMNGITDEQRQTNMQTWRDFYRFVVNSTDEEFVANLGDWVILDSALYFYLFTERYTMLDNRAKNVFFHYGKCEDEKYRFDFWDYDNDTAIGINNSGELTMTYGKEDIDYRTDNDPSSGYVFNAAESTFFCRIRDLMKDQLQTMFIDRESQNCWSASGLINQFDEWQAQFPEELWRIDIERKYLRTYRDGNTRFLAQMMNGRKKYQRRQFERDQEKYMATKYYGTTATSDQIMFRCNTPTQAIVTPDYTLHLTPYSDMYLSVMFGATYRTQIRAKAGQQYDITCPFTTMDDTAVLIYCASRIQAIGDLSRCYIHDNDFSKASKLQELIIGSTVSGYQNTFLTNLGIGNNTLLGKLDIQNTPNLVQVLNLSSCGNLEELYAYGSGLTGITFADGGKIRIAQLPAITSITMRNLAYLTGLDVTEFNNLSTLVIENCNTVDILDILETAQNINRVRITGINWNLENADLLARIYKMYGIDKNGYNVQQSVLAGSVHVPVMREQLLADYSTAWSDLEIIYDTLINQFAVTFVNDDGTVLDVQYVDKGEKPVDPVTRSENPISTPLKESTVSTDFTFTGWDTAFVNIFAPMTIKAVYTESLRKYTVKYVSKGIVLQESIGDYGSTIFYEGDIPTYTAEESAYKYYLFDRWNQSGFINGDKIINAVYDVCEYSNNYFDGKELNSLRPVEIYAMTKLGIESNYVDLKDTLSFDVGYDYSYDDIEDVTFINKKTEFTGNNYIDTGVPLFEEDRSFVLVVDYEISSNNTTNAVLTQCYQNNGTNGFKLWYSNQPRLAWGTTSITPSSVNTREVIVLRHIKGETGLHVYTSNITGADSSYTEISRSKITSASSTLVFGCGKADDGEYENYAVGAIYWSKLWYTDLGDEACKNLVMWTHETRTLEMCGFKRFYLSDNSSKRCSMTFLDTQLLPNNMVLSSGSTNSGGWASYTLNSYLNSRFYNAISIPYRQLIKQVIISSSIGDKSMEIGTSNCYIAIPAAIEVDSSMTSEPYCYEGSAIEYFTTNNSRICRYADGTEGSYWLRSPNISYSSYVYKVDANGSLYGYNYAYENDTSVRVMISI